MLISTCITSRQNGVLSTRNTTRLSAIMLIIGRISEGSHISSSTMCMNFALTGRLGLLSASMKKDAFFKLLVQDLMVGKSKNITLRFIKLNLVKR